MKQGGLYLNLLYLYQRIVRVIIRIITRVRVRFRRRKMALKRSERGIKRVWMGFRTFHTSKITL